MSDQFKKGSGEVAILATLEGSPRHGYEIAKLIQARSKGALTFHVASLYPTLYRLERQGLIAGRWREKAGERKRRYYRLTPAGRRALDAHRRTWRAFFDALNLVTRFQHSGGRG